MELLSEIWDKTTDALTAFSEGVSEGLVRLFGSSNERKIRQMRSLVVEINELEPGMTVLSEDELRAKTDELRQRRAAGESLDDLAARGIRGRARVRPPLFEYASFRRSVDGRDHPARRKHRRNGHRGRERPWSLRWPPISTPWTAAAFTW